ncbi:MAG TPA: hypothetical protein VJA21_10265 [Verrucomicrobiae bacterium]
MRSIWKVLGFACIPAAALLCAGCSGINASKSISPATFLLPGLMKADPPPASPERALPVIGPGTEVAQF